MTEEKLAVLRKKTNEAMRVNTAYRWDVPAATATEVSELLDYVEELQGTVRRVAEAPEITSYQVQAITTAYEQGVGKGIAGVTVTNPYSNGYRCDEAWQRGYDEGCKKECDR